MDDLVQWLHAQYDADEQTARAEYEPARVLVEIEAKRQLLAAYSEGAPRDVIDAKWARGYVTALGRAVRLAALPYADRPGYRKEWRP